MKQEKLMANRKIAPKTHFSDNISFLKPKQCYLNNGMPVYCIRGGTQDITKIEIVFKAGSYHQNKTLAAYAAANLLKAGTSQKTSTEINHIWDFYGSSLQVDAQKDIISIGFFCLNKQIDPLLNLFFELISQASFPEEEMQVFLKNRLQQFIVDKEKVSYMARAHFSSLLFGENHPYGNMLYEEDFDSINREDVVNYYKSFLHPANAICLISGQFPEDILQKINLALHHYEWSPGTRLATKVRVPSTETELKHFFSKKDAVQSSFRIGKHLVGRSHRDYHKIMLTNVLLGGYFGSRLMKNIRQNKGYTYGINSAVVSLLHASYFFISSQVGNDVREAALEEVYKEIVRLRKTPAKPEELRMMKNYLAGALLRSFDGPFAQTERFKEILLFEQDYSYYKDQFQAIKTITAKQIQDTAAQYFDESSMIEVVVG